MASRSGSEVREALFSGKSVSWGFNPQEKRVVVKLPPVLGGGTQILCIAGGYTFAARTPIRLEEPVEVQHGRWLGPA
jgi:hypothetical protein